MERKTYRKTRFVEDKYLMDWIGENLPSASAGFMCTDLDLILRDRAGNFMFIETKRKGAGVKTHQSVTFQILDQALRRLDGQTIKVKVGAKQVPINIKYKGFKLLQFEGTTFENGDVYLNGKKESEARIRSIFSFKK